MATLRNMPGHLIRRFQQAAVAIFQSAVSELGYDLTPVQYAALAEIQENPGIDQVTLAGLIAYDRTTIAGVVDRLVKKDLLARTVSDKDRRARVLTLTERGRAALLELGPVVEQAQSTMLMGLTESEARQFMDLLAKATEAVNQLSRAPLKED